MRRRICQKRQNPAQVAAERLAHRNTRRRERYKARRQPAEQPAGQPDPQEQAQPAPTAQCPICWGEVVDPMACAKCRNAFCAACIKAHIDARGVMAACPLCRVHIFPAAVYELQHGAPPQHQARPYIDSEWAWLDDSGESVEDSDR
ncbi:hypothetical protein JG688_00018444 [Phytophthora aleatoria]|uniref:RING-type domain-containing protein n=1 Tax=Phytophthora aleatoria TaxID=2496075 RepID=A0A8J5I8Q4_9STRA|nr:hypothetical protein JG688_00018444 [Phytophthora aleatoria]